MVASSWQNYRVLPLLQEHPEFWNVCWFCGGWKRVSSVIDQITTSMIVFIIYNSSRSSKVLTFAEKILCSRHCAMCYMHYIIYTMLWGKCSNYFYWGNRGSTWTSNLTRVTQLVCGRKEMQTHLSLTPESWLSAKMLNWLTCIITHQD